jgi:hypothetical protein
MSLLTKESDLLQFINQKKQKKIDVSTRKIFDMFSKLITTGMVETFNKLSLSKYVISCTESIKILFWFLITYTNNLKLTMFLSERAVLLFNEYIVMTKNTVLGHNSFNSVNLSEIKNFIYKKTVGPIQINNLHKNSVITPSLIKSGNLLYNIYTVLLIKIINSNDDRYDLTKIETQIEDTLAKTFKCLGPLFFELSKQPCMTCLDIIGEFLGTTVNYNGLDIVPFINSIIVVIWLYQRYTTQGKTTPKIKLYFRRNYLHIVEVCQTKLHKTFLHDNKQLDEWF